MEDLGFLYEEQTYNDTYRRYFVKKTCVFDMFFFFFRVLGHIKVRMSPQEAGQRNAPHTKNIHRLDRLGLNTGQIDMYIIIIYNFIYTYVVYMLDTTSCS